MADGHGATLERGILSLPDPLNVSEFVFGSGVFAAGGVTVELSGRDCDEAFGSKFREELGDDWAFNFAVRAPVGPKEKKDR